MLNKILEIVESEIRPALNADGGDIEVVSFNDNVLSVKLCGACCGCPRASETLKYGVEHTLHTLVSEDIVVKAV